MYVCCFRKSMLNWKITISICLSVYLPIYLSIYLNIHLAFYLSNFYLSFLPSICLSIYRIDLYIVPFVETWVALCVVSHERIFYANDRWNVPLNTGIRKLSACGFIGVTHKTTILRHLAILLQSTSSPFFFLHSGHIPMEYPYRESSHEINYNSHSPSR